MTNDLENLKKETIAALENSSTLEEWNDVRVSIIGRTGKLVSLLRQVGTFPVDQRRERGQRLNQLRDELTKIIELRGEDLRNKELEDKLMRESEDISEPVLTTSLGVVHPISHTVEEMVEIFSVMGFHVEQGPNIEDQWHNFSALNTPDHHPARTEQDTFYLPAEKEGQLPRVLRTQTSGVQIRTMLAKEPPLRIIAPGRTYRADHDSTHSPMFHQCEGLVIEKNVTLSHLKGCLTDFLKTFFQKDDLPVRFRASYFPFTEPSLEIDIGWSKAKGCIAKNEDWLEVLGAGMVHPRVLANCGIDPSIWQGFAFGMGIERLTMLKYGISDLRSFYTGDLRWLRHYGFSPFSTVSLAEGL